MPRIVRIVAAEGHHHIARHCRNQLTTPVSPPSQGNVVELRKRVFLFKLGCLRQVFYATDLPGSRQGRLHYQFEIPEHEVKPEGLTEYSPALCANISETLSIL